jgi:hypothetical protein
MSADKQERLNRLLVRNVLQKDRRETSRLLTSSNVKHSALAHDMHNDLIAAMRGKGNILHDIFIRKKFDKIAVAIEKIARYEETLGNSVVVIPYDIDQRAAFLVSLVSILNALRANPFLLSRDGFVLLDPAGQAGIILDYHGDTPESSAELTALGLATRDLSKLCGRPSKSPETIIDQNNGHE